MKVSLDVAGVVSALFAAALLTTASTAHAGGFPPVFKATAKGSAKGVAASERVADKRDSSEHEDVRSDEPEFESETPAAKADEDVPEPDGVAEDVTEAVQEGVRDAAKSGAQAVIEKLSEPTPKENPDQKKPEAKAAAPGSQPASDYYGQRAKGLLAGEGGAGVKQHPLAAAHPGMDVVVCSAGCNNAPAEIVYMQPSNRKVEVTTVGEMQQTAGSAATVAGAAQIVCIGGCYDMPKVFSAMPSAASQIGDWTTAAPVPVRAGSGDWMRTIDTTRGEPARP